MEPMALGSPTSSPSSPPVAQNFLPNYLMGDPQPTNNFNTSPGRNMRKATSTPDTRAHSKLFSHFDSPTQFTPQKQGPPSQGLFDTIEHKKKPASPVLNSTMNEGIVPCFGRSFSKIGEETLNSSFNPNFSRMDRIDTQWVTVFGFPPSALSLVLAQLSNCGMITEKKIPTQGNWVHVKFANLSDVPRALALNGRCINNSIMIGVTLHYNKENKENENVFTSPIRARSLRQSFVNPNMSNTILPPQNVPQKSTGLVSKAMEYVFGW